MIPPQRRVRVQGWSAGQVRGVGRHPPGGAQRDVRGALVSAPRHPRQLAAGHPVLQGDPLPGRGWCRYHI